MKSKDKISVIVSAYNTEKYIQKCIDSILNQTYKNLELIIVNDCSTDATKTIIEENIKRDSRIKFINNKHNMGLSYSRNIALKNATGDYIGYVDSDDYIPNNYYETLLTNLKDSNADISVCDINLIDNDSNTVTRVICGKTNGAPIDFINNGLAASVCNKLFKKNVISKYKFSEGKINEDLAVTFPLIYEYECVYNDTVAYNYIQRNNSIQNSKFSEKRFDIFYGVDLTIERLKKTKAEKKIIDCIIFYQIIILLIDIIPREKNFFKRIKLMKKFRSFSFKYNITKNIILRDFLKKLLYKKRYYYKILLFCYSHKMFFTYSLLISFSNLFLKILKKNVIRKNIELKDLVLLARKQSLMKLPKISVSVIIPNYNYANFLYERLYSILSQNYKINEIIILDDCSRDNSLNLINEITNILNKYINIKTVFNKINSGSAFKQWQKGFEIATSEYVWIAEADDYCSKKLLRKLVSPIIKDGNIIISYANTAFIDAQGKILKKSVVSEIDIMKTGHWNSNYVTDGKEEFKKYAYLNCTIANVSSAIIKNQNYNKYFKLSGKFKQCGDWLLYSNIMQLGKIAYTKKALNYYRVHGNNVSSVTKKQEHIKEIQKIHKYYDETYGLNKKQKHEINKRYKFLQKVWNLDNKK